MPTASAAHKTGWAPYAVVADPVLQQRRVGQRPTVNPPADRRRAPGIAAPRPSSAAASSSSAQRPPEVWVKLSWEDYLKVLKKYVRREGHANVPLEYEERGVRLGVWLSRQWAEYSSTTRGGYLSEARKIRLAEAGVVWGGPAPPASGVVGPEYLNERKWDDKRDYDCAAEQLQRQMGCRRVLREFDASKPAVEGTHWRPYTADSDPHAKKWVERQRAKRLDHYEEEVPPEPRYIPYGHPPIPGLSTALATRLKAAKAQMDAEAQARRAGRRQTQGAPRAEEKK